MILSVRVRDWRVLKATGVSALTGVLFFAASSPAVAQQDPASPPTTKNGLEQLIETLLPPATTVPPGTPPPGPPADPGAPAPATDNPLPVADPAAGDGGDSNAGIIPADAQALIDSLVRTGGRSTRELMDQLRELEQVGYTEAEAAIMGMGQFPVAGEAAWSDDFLYPRFNPSFHLHQGNDIFAARGVPVRAPNDGTVRFGEDPAGGKAAYVTTADGTYYYMAHLDGYADIPSGSRVSQGDVVGFVGDSGNATGTPHVHFEVHPNGGAAVNPKSILDGWLDDALAAAPALLATYRINQPQAMVNTGQLRRFDQIEPVGVPDGAETLLSATSDASGPVDVGVARVRTPGAARRVDVPRALIGALVTVEEWQKADDLSRALLSPVTPQLVEHLMSAGA